METSLADTAERSTRRVAGGTKAEAAAKLRARTTQRICDSEACSGNEVNLEEGDNPVKIAANSPKFRTDPSCARCRHRPAQCLIPQCRHRPAQCLIPQCAMLSARQDRAG